MVVSDINNDRDFLAVRSKNLLNDTMVRAGGSAATWRVPWVFAATG
jgi:hypothetical protein